MIGLQLLLMAWVYLRLSEYIPHFLALQSLFTLAMVFYLYSNSMDAAAKRFFSPTAKNPLSLPELTAIMFHILPHFVKKETAR